MVHRALWAIGRRAMGQRPFRSRPYAALDIVTGSRQVPPTHNNVWRKLCLMGRLTNFYRVSYQKELKKMTKKSQKQHRKFGAYNV